MNNIDNINQSHKGCYDKDMNDVLTYFVKTNEGVINKIH